MRCVITAVWTARRPESRQAQVPDLWELGKAASPGYGQLSLVWAVGILWGLS